MWVNQLVEYFGAEEEMTALRAFTNMRDQEGFLGGGVALVDDGGWLVQGFFEDKSRKVDSWFPEGMLRVFVPEEYEKSLGIILDLERKII